MIVFIQMKIKKMIYRHLLLNLQTSKGYSSINKENLTSIFNHYQQVLIKQHSSVL
jgi:hypothetical protein